MKELFVCPCCGYKTLSEETPGSYEICGICFWEDDGVQLDDPDYEGGANHISLRTAQRNFKAFGACEQRSLKHVEKDRSKYVYVGEKDLSHYRRVSIDEMYEVFELLKIPSYKLLELYTNNSLNESKLTFSCDELEKCLSYDEIVDYYGLTDDSGLFLELSGVQNMTIDEKSKRLAELKSIFDSNLKLRKSN